MALWTVLLLGALCGAQELREQDASCSAEGCYAVYLQRRTFLESWRSCREQGGTLVTIRHPEEADLIEDLFNGLGLTGDQGKMRFWIGLQRQPRQCSPTRPLRGFTWVTGDQDTLYTNWLRPEGAPGSTCAAPRCVVMSYGTSHAAQSENFQWLDGPCTLPVDGFVCKFLYKGMCPAIMGEGGPAMYTTPFQLVSTLLTFVPFGSVASVPCSGSSGVPDLSILCMLKEDGTIGWSKEVPYCPEEQQRHELGLHQLPEAMSCDHDNGGCEHICVDEGEDYYCECDDGFALMDDGHSCAQADPCESNPCQYDCTSDGHNYLCSCLEGYILGPDGRSCQDVDECTESSCDQLCLNFAGGFECQCHLGYQLEDGQCRDVDECAALAPCEHSCENTAGSYACHCHLGFSPAEEDPHNCVDTDECRIADMCQQMCVNYIGGFECYCNEGYELDTDGISCHPLPDARRASEDQYPLRPTSLIPDDEDMWEYSDEETSDEDLSTQKTIEIEVTTQEKATPPKVPTTTTTPIRTTSVAGVNTARFTVWTTQLPVTSKAIATTLNKVNLLTIDQLLVPLSEEGEEVADGSLYETDLPSNEESLSTPFPTRSKKLTSTSTTSPPVNTPSPKSLILSPDSIALEDNDHTSTHLSFTSTFTVTSSRAPLPGSEGSQRAEEKRDDRWLLVALLVPLCIFLVIMLALGIVYCTRCGAKAKPKSVTDCYRWITNKNPAPTPGKPSV